MAVVIIPNLGTTPLIDEISPDDFLLVGDASDGGSLKRALVESLPSSDTTDKLAIADYSFNTIPDKPSTFPPDLHTHADKLAIADYGWEAIPNKPLAFTPNVHGHAISEIENLDALLPTFATVDYSQIKSSTKPLTRANGSALQVGDTWINTADLVTCFWNGTYWLGTALIVNSSLEYNGAGGTHPPVFASISQVDGGLIFVESFTASYTSFGTNPLTDFVLLQLQTLQTRTTGRTAIGSISTANATSSRKVTAQINQAFTTGFAGAAIALFAIGSVYGGGGGASCFWQGAVAYRRIY